MATEVVMPQMGESITEGTLTKWLKQVGDTIARDEPLFEISTDKVDAEIPSPAAGVLKEIRVQEGSTVEINSIVAVLDAEGGAAASTPAAPPAAEAPKVEAAKAEAATPAPAAPAAGTDILMPQMGESITEGTITKWLKKVGDTVQRDEPIFEISTDKVECGDSVARRRRPHRDQGSRRLDRVDQHRGCGHRRRISSSPCRRHSRGAGHAHAQRGSTCSRDCRDRDPDAADG